MSQYKEYGWNEMHTPAHDYLYLNLRKMLSGSNNCILDIGCGNGRMANKLLAEGFDVYGVDASEQGINIANKESGKKGRFFVCDIESKELPQDLKNKKFDTIISTEVIEHLYAPREYIDFCKIILTNGNAHVHGGILLFQHLIMGISKI